MDPIRRGGLTPAQWPGMLLPRLRRWLGVGDLRVERPRSGPPRAPRVEAADAFPNRPRVLVVDDNPVNQLAASEMLHCWGITPLLAADGAEAVALACELRFDLILMDLQMPVLDGLGATRQVRRFERDHARARVPVVAYTSSASSVDHSLLRECGLDDLLDKPCDAQTLRQCLMRWCALDSRSLAGPGWPCMATGSTR